MSTANPDLILALSVLPFIILFALALLVWIQVRGSKSDIDADLRNANKELQRRPRVGCITNHRTDSGERVSIAPIAAQACGGGICRKNAACKDHHCPGHPHQSGKIAA